MATEKLTDKIVKGLTIPDADKRTTYDSEVTGFGCRVYASGARAFILNYRTKAGRERRLTIGSFPEWDVISARKEAAELKKAIDRGGDPLGDVKASRAAPTVDELCDRFIAEYLPRKKLSTQYTYKGQIETIIRPELGRLKVGEVSFDDVDALHRKLTASGTPYRANRVISTVSRMFSMAIKWRWRTDNNPCRGIERNLEHKRRRYLSPDELERLLAALAAYSERQSADIIRLLMLTGARKGEVLAARWEDFDLTTGRWSKPAATTKQRTQHDVPLSAAARALLEQLRRRTNSEWLFPAGDSHRKNITDAWAAICRAANIKGTRVHDLRHTFASVLASTGHSLPLIGALLGHTVPTTTARYAHLFDDPLRAATESAGKILSGQ
jgi:integrase